MQRGVGPPRKRQRAHQRGPGLFVVEFSDTDEESDVEDKMTQLRAHNLACAKAHEEAQEARLQAMRAHLLAQAQAYNEANPQLVVVKPKRPFRARWAPSLKQKAEIFKEYSRLEGSEADKARQLSHIVNPSTLRNLVRDQETLKAVADNEAYLLNATGSHKGGRGRFNHANLKRIGGKRGGAWPFEEGVVYQWFCGMRNRGRRVTSRQIIVKMKEELLKGDCVAQDYDGPSKGWFRGFRKRNKLAYRRKTNSKAQSVTRLAPSILAWVNDLAFLREYYKQDATEEEKGLTWFEKYGVMPPHLLFNVDQIPIAFSSGDTRTWTQKGEESVWLRQVGAGLDKRQATLQLCIRMAGSQPKPTVIFRGKAEPAPLASGRESKAQKKRGEEIARMKTAGPNVHAMFQPKAWMCGETNLRYVEIFAESVIECLRRDALPTPRRIWLFADNLGAQTRKEWIGAIRTCLQGTLPHTEVLVEFGPAGATHLWQPVDNNVGVFYKKNMGGEFDTWMSRQNDDQSTNTLTVSVSADEMRHQLACWVSRCYDKLEDMRRRSEDEEVGSSLIFKAFSKVGFEPGRGGDIHVLKKLPEKYQVIDTLEETRERVRKGEKPKSEQVVSALDVGGSASEDEEGESENEAVERAAEQRLVELKTMADEIEGVVQRC